jgi:Bacterial alpha-L-rhamnosidase 6 hairpin glycosidase domain
MCTPYNPNKMKKHLLIRLYCMLACTVAVNGAAGQSWQIRHYPAGHQLVLVNKKMQLTLDYANKAVISSLLINGGEVMDVQEGVYSSIRTRTARYSTQHLAASPTVQVTNSTVRIGNIVYGDAAVRIREDWVFSQSADSILFSITRSLSNDIVAEELASPVFVFKDMSTWEGAYQDYGGLAWFYLFNKQLDTYGVHSHLSQFWNSKTGNGLLINVTANGQTTAMDYSRTAKDQLTCKIALSATALLPAHDSGTHRRRFLRDRTDIWAPVKMKAGLTRQQNSLSYFDYTKTFNRGTMPGINGTEAAAVLNTIARIGVIDRQHFGGNSWHTPYGPICLHEQYIAQMGIGINDEKYLKGYTECLDFYRDNAIRPDGHVWARWAYTNEDMMPGEVTPKGFYEAQWGYLLDANPDYVTNVAELYDQTGDLAWVKRHQQSCEKALDWIIHRDSDGDGLVEMLNDSYTQRKGSDWLDIIWASHENAFVNAKLYHALQCWAGIEAQLGNTIKANYYKLFAAKLKTRFNQSTAEGGLWDADKKCYIHWREKDNAVHGNNLVTPVNFMAIAYGICEDSTRKKEILDAIEAQMQKEQLFFWPVCMFSYAPGEGNDWQFPFPNYENGDIFLSWGSVAVNAYAGYKPELALKYVNNVLAQYAKDGLAFQRYGRAKQNGLGDDILSGNSLSVVGLYQSVYGINPKYNRLYINPHITPAMEGSQLIYHYRNQLLQVALSMQKYRVFSPTHSITAATDFGFYSRGNELLYFYRNADTASMRITAAANAQLSVDIQRWETNSMVWTHSVTGPSKRMLTYKIYKREAGAAFRILINGKQYAVTRAGKDGVISFTLPAGTGADEITVQQ